MRHTLTATIHFGPIVETARDEEMNGNDNNNSNMSEEHSRVSCGVEHQTRGKNERIIWIWVSRCGLPRQIDIPLYIYMATTGLTSRTLDIGGCLLR